MPRETKEQRAQRLADEQTALMLEQELFRKGMPAKLMELQALASAAQVSTKVDLTPTGPAVTFTRYLYNGGCNDLEETLTYDSDKWTVTYLESRLQGIKDDLDAKARRQALAESVWKDKLTSEEREALKENIRNLI